MVFPAVSSVLLLLYLMVAAGCASAPVVSVVDPPAGGPHRPVVVDHPVIALVLGGGAARGFAHVGVIKTLEEHGISADIVVGTSAGSVVGALYAGGIRGDRLVAAALELDKKRLSDWVFPSRGFIRGELLQQYINESLRGRRIQELDKVFAAVATDLRSGGLVAFTRGDTGMAVRASSSVPGVFQPVMIGGREYVDGGLVSPVPVRVARRMGADIVIAVDVSRKAGDSGSLESTLDVLLQTIFIMGQTIGNLEVRGAEVVIRPDVSAIQMADFAHREWAIEQGAIAAKKAIPLVRSWLERKGREKSAHAAREGTAGDGNLVSSGYR